MESIILGFLILPLEYSEPIVVNQKTLSSNRLLRVTLDHSISLDLSALADFHHYNLEEWRYTLDQFFKENAIDYHSISLSLPYFNMIKDPTMTLQGELLFVVESVLFALIEKNAPSLLFSSHNHTIKINGLYNKNVSPINVPECLKIKISPTSESLIETYSLMTEMLLVNPEILFRLDGNRRFELHELIVFMSEIEKNCGIEIKNSIEYLEEPLKNKAEYTQFNQVSPYPLALDESMSGFLLNLDLLKELPPDTTLILKPSLFGISKCFEIIQKCRELGLCCVISSTYESKSAIRPLLYLALQSPFTYHGFDTLKYLPEELSIKTENYTLTI